MAALLVIFRLYVETGLLLNLGYARQGPKALSRTLAMG